MTPRRLAPLLVLPLLAACEAPPAAVSGLLPGSEPEVAAPPPLPPQVLAALPAGAPPSVVQRNTDGCYLLAIEVTDPPSGFPLRDALGNPVCDGSPVVVADPLAPPATVAPVAPAAVVPAAAPVAPLAPGSITPPAPLAPLNPA